MTHQPKVGEVWHFSSTVTATQLDFLLLAEASTAAFTHDNLFSGKVLKSSDSHLFRITTILSITNDGRWTKAASSFEAYHSPFGIYDELERILSE